MNQPSEKYLFESGVTPVSSISSETNGSASRRKRVMYYRHCKVCRHAWWFSVGTGVNQILSIGLVPPQMRCFIEWPKMEVTSRFCSFWSPPSSRQPNCRRCIQQQFVYLYRSYVSSTCPELYQVFLVANIWQYFSGVPGDRHNTRPPTLICRSLSAGSIQSRKN